MVRQVTRGRGRLVFLGSAPSDLAAPTQAEITAGTDITPSVRSVDGWDLSVADLDIADLSSDFQKTGAGTSSAASSSVAFYADDAGAAAILTALAEDTAGWMAFLRNGQASTEPSKIWPCQVKVHNDRDVQAMDEPPTTVVEFGLTDRPTKGTQAA
ncbi:MAG: hypothetical protein AAGA99_27315 [Actinomycetota bacterium]